MEEDKRTLLVQQTNDYYEIERNTEAPTISNTAKFKSINTDDRVGVEQLLDENIHRTMQRTSTGVTPAELGFDLAKVRTIFKIPVKDGVTYCNILAIPLVPMVSMILSTYLNAQVIFLLDDPNMFNVP